MTQNGLKWILNTTIFLRLPFYTFCKTTFYLINLNCFLYITVSTNITFKKHFNNSFTFII